jgi:Holliday junction DNA helicase RuvB
LQQGFIGRTPRGRIVTLKAYRHLGMSGPQRSSSPQNGLFDVPDQPDEPEAADGTG